MSTAPLLEPDPIRRILAATDFSSAADRALDHAIELARQHDSEVALVHVMQPELPPLAAPEMVIMPPNYDELLRESSIEGLHRAAERVKKKGVRTIEHLAVGRPAPGIVDAASALDADLVVVGTRGHTGFKHLLLGSVAEEVVRSVGCPVLTIHPGDEEPLENVQRLLFPTDFSEPAEDALVAASRLLAGSSAPEVLLLHTYNFVPAVVPMGGFGMGVAPTYVENAREIAMSAADRVAERLRALGFAVEVLIECGDTAEIVTNIARERDVDLIALGTRGHSKFRQFLLGSTAERVVENAPCPVLTAHQHMEPTPG